MTFIEVDAAIGRVTNSAYQHLVREVNDDPTKRAAFDEAVANAKRLGKQRGTATKRIIRGQVVPSIPPLYRRVAHSVLAERDRAHSGNQTIGQLLLGEPLRGRSALERRTEDASA